MRVSSRARWLLTWPTDRLELKIFFHSYLVGQALLQLFAQCDTVACIGASDHMTETQVWNPSFVLGWNV